MIEHLYSVLAAGVSYPVVFGVSDDAPSLPRASVFRTSSTRERTIDGPGTAETRVQVSVFGETVAIADAAAQEAETALANYRGGPIIDIHCEGPRDGTAEDSGRVASVILLFTVTHI